MSYAEKKSIYPSESIYRLTEQEVNELVNRFVEEEVGIPLNLVVSGYEDNENDVFVRWDTEDIEDYEETFTKEQLNKIEELGVHSEEWFMTRDCLFQRIFDNPLIGYRHEWDEKKGERYYEIIVIHR